MFNRKTTALAAASALILSGCATTAWQLPAHHPADPAAQSGHTPPVTALERYRAGTTTPGAEPPAGATEHEGHEDMQHHHRSDQREEAR